MSHFCHIKNYRSINKEHYVRIADGSLSKVFGYGNVCISNQLSLSVVLFVPRLDSNLSSIQKLSHHQNCSAKFFSNLCEFQDLDSGKVIDNAKVSSGPCLVKVGQPFKALSTSRYPNNSLDLNSNKKK